MPRTSFKGQIISLGRTWRAPALRFLATQLISILSLSAIVEVRAQTGDRGLAFNDLTQVVIDDDGQSIRLFGKNIAFGPRRPIPYMQMLAAAMLLPDERGDPGVHGSIPSFSLDPAKSTLESLPSLQKRMNSSEAESLMQKYFADPAIRRTFLRDSVSQAWEEVRELLKRRLYRYWGREKADTFIGTINSSDDLVSAMSTLRSEGFFGLTEDAIASAFDELVGQGVQRFQTKSGNIFYFPEGTTEKLYGAAFYSEPHFFGIHRDTQFARIVFEADIAIKFLAGSVKLKMLLPFHQTLMEWQLRNATPQEMIAGLSSICAIQVNLTKLQLKSSDDGRIISFDSVEMAISVGPLDRSEHTSNTQLSYSKFVSGHFDQYAAALTSLWEFRELSKVVAVAKVLKSKGIRIYIPLDRSWSPPSTVKASWLAGSLGAGGTNLYLVTYFFGGVGLLMRDVTQIAHLPADMGDRFKNASAQLTGMANTADSGVCFDGRLGGCKPGEALGTIRIDLPAPGSASLSKTTIDRMQRDPEARRLLDEENRAKKTLSDAGAAVKQKEVALSNASPNAKGQLQVDLAQARQAETVAKSTLRTAQIKVSDAAKVIEEVELVDSPPRK